MEEFFELDIVTAESKAFLLENLKKRMLGASVEPYEVYFVDKAGAKKCVEAKEKEVSCTGQPADFVVFHDITRRKKTSVDSKNMLSEWRHLLKRKLKRLKKAKPSYVLSLVQRLTLCLCLMKQVQLFIGIPQLKESSVTRKKK